MSMTPTFTTLRPTLRMAGVWVLAIALSSVARADQEEPSATPFRPTVTSGAALSAPGWLEVEFGGPRLGGNGADQRNSWPYLLKYSFNDRIAVLVGGDAYVSMAPAQAPPFSGAGDTTLTLKYRAPDAMEGKSFGLEATVKLPTAADGIGSAERDYSLKTIFGVDLADGLHLDTNLMATRLGGVGVDQSSTQWTWAAAISRQIGDAWTLAGDVSGTSQRGAPTTAQFLSAVSYAASKRIVVDGGFAAGLNSNTPKFTMFSGLTVLIGKVF